MDSDLQVKLNTLKERFLNEDEGSIVTINSWEKSLKEAILTKEFGEHPVVVQIRAELQKRLDGLKALLSESEDLTEKERDKAFAKKEIYKWFLGLFGIADSTIDTINTIIEEELQP